MSGARVYVQPLANERGDYMDEVEITDSVIGDMQFNSQISKNKWFAGLLRPGKDEFTFKSTDSRFDPSSNTGSLFVHAGSDNARVRVEMPQTRGGSDYQTIYRGLVTSKESRFDTSEGTSTWVCRTPDYALVNASINPGLIVENMPIRTAIANIFNDSEISNYISGVDMTQFFDPTRAGLFIGDEPAILGDDSNANATLERLLQSTDNIMTFHPHTNRVHIMRRGSTWLSSGIELTNPQDIAQEEGTELVFNNIVCKTGLASPDDTYSVSNTGSISLYGQRTLEQDLSWIRDLDKVDEVARNLLARLAYPKRSIEVVYDGWIGPTNWLIPGAIFGLNIAPEATAGSARWGKFRWGDGAQYRYNAARRIQGTFYIEEVEISAQDNRIKLRLREIDHG